MSGQQDTVEIISIAPTGKPGDYGIRALVRRPTTVSNAMCDAVYHSASGKVEIINEQGGVQSEPNRAEPIRQQVEYLVGKSSDLRSFAFLKIDIVEHSRISSEHQQLETEHTWDNLVQLVRTQVMEKGGEMWGWQGDGGLCAFGGDTKELVAVQCALSILEAIDSFNKDSVTGNKIQGEIIRLRTAVHTGTARERPNRGEIHSRDINFVAHLEAQRACPNSISISRETYIELSADLQMRFTEVEGTFEGKGIYTTAPLEQFKEYVSTRRSSTDELQREVIELRHEVVLLRRKLDTGHDETIVRLFRAEITENILSITKDIRYTTMPLKSMVWDQHEGEIEFLPTGLHDLVRAAYVEIQHINHLSRGHEVGSNSRQEYLRDRLRSAKDALLPLLEQIKVDLETLLPVNSK